MTQVTRFQFLDIVRGIAIASVVTTHSAALVLSQTPVNVVTETVGQTLSSFRFGVELFFLLSGFLIGFIYDKPGKSRPFLIMRFFRLWPLWSTFTGIWLTYKILENPISSSRAIPEALANLVFLGWAYPGTDNSFLGGQWSIQVEVFCYLIFAVIKGRSARTLFLAVFVLNLIGILNNGALKVLSPEIAAPISNLTVWSGFSFFVAGVLLSRISKSNSWASEALGMFRSVGGRFSAALAIISTLFAPAYYGSILEAAGFVTGGVFFALAVGQENPIAKGFALLGRYSYSIFFSHFFVLLAIEYVLSKFILNTMTGLFALGVVIAVTLLISTFLAKLTMVSIEGPALKAGKALIAGKS